MTKRLILVATIVGALAAPAVARADTVTEWNQNASTALMVTAAQGPQLSVPNMAMVHGAVYDAVNAIGGGYGGVQDALAPRADAAGDVRCAVRRVAHGNPGRRTQDARDRGRQCRSG